VSSAIKEFFPRLAARRQWRRWPGILYPRARLHVALDRGYFARLWRETLR
jgi:hypothetical protein